MMGHRQVEQAALFYEFSLEGHVPSDHLSRSAVGTLQTAFKPGQREIPAACPHQSSQV